MIGSLGWLVILLAILKGVQLWWELTIDETLLIAVTLLISIPLLLLRELGRRCLNSFLIEPLLAVWLVLAIVLLRLLKRLGLLHGWSEVRLPCGWPGVVTSPCLLTILHLFDEFIDLCFRLIHVSLECWIEAFPGE